MANTQINISGNGKTILATAGKFCDRNIDVNVSVPASGITPTGTKEIEQNGIFDVTNFASARVNVPVPAQKIYTFPITVSICLPFNFATSNVRFGIPAHIPDGICSTESPKVIEVTERGTLKELKIFSPAWLSTRLRTVPIPPPWSWRSPPTP